MLIDPRSIQVRRDRELRAELVEDMGVKKALEKIKHIFAGRGYGYRHDLITRTLRLTRAMSPEIADIIAQCKEVIGYKSPVEVYLTPDPVFNASCYKEPNGNTTLTIAARLLEAFTPAELKFVIGHELGHATFDHFGLPMPLAASIEEIGIPFVSQAVSLKLYAWCRAAEFSADRIGLVCAQDADAAASGFFKLASGISSPRIRPDLESFAKQVEGLGSVPEAREKMRDDDILDCFSTHPYNPIRVRAVWAFSQSQPYLALLKKPAAQALTLEDVEKQIEADMELMEPTYLHNQGGDNDVLRRLLFTAGLAVADASNGVAQVELDALGKLLGPSFADMPKDVKSLLTDLDGRIAAAKSAPMRSRAQLVQHLTIVAAADGVVDDAELKVMEHIADALAVETRVIHETIRGAMHPMD